MEWLHTLTFVSAISFLLRLSNEYPFFARLEDLSRKTWILRGQCFQ